MKMMDKRLPLNLHIVERHIGNRRPACCNNMYSTDMFQQLCSLRMWKKKWKYFMFFSILIGFVGLVYKMWPVLEDLTQIAKCPACFGISACSQIVGGHIVLDPPYTFSGLIGALGSKNVFFGSYNNNKVVLKMLGERNELERLDALICEEASLMPGCEVSSAIMQIEDIVTKLETHISKPTSNLHLCPSAASLSILLENVYLKHQHISLKILHAIIWTTVLINPEPVILQILLAEDGWPVPRYLGSCGRIIIEEYAGEMLLSYYDAPWIVRANLALQLLIAARKLTDGHRHFRFYLTDVSPDNIAVDLHGKIKFVDLENIIVVDKAYRKEMNSLTWNISHMSEHYDCNNCFAFSAEEICNHYISDHNYYAVCQHILAADASRDLFPAGLLHDTPEDNQNINELLQECSHPTIPRGRYEAADKLINSLRIILGTSKDYG